MPRTHPGLLRCLVLASVVTGLASGCLMRPTKQEVFKGSGIDVFLRSETLFIKPIDKGYSHPVTIAPVRIANILSRIDLRPPKGVLLKFEKDKERVGAIQTDMLYPIAEAVSKALAQANPTQEVVVMAIRDTKRFGIFDHDYLTSFVVYASDDRLYFHLSRYDWEIQKRRDDQIPEPRVGDHPQSFKLYTSTAMSLVSDQSVAIDWRDAIFARETRTKVLPSGEVVRREILLESPPEVDEIDDPVARMPDDLSPEQLRALADVEQARREGRITETEYRSQRREILAPTAEQPPKP